MDEHVCSEIHYRHQNVIDPGGHPGNYTRSHRHHIMRKESLNEGEQLAVVQHTVILQIFGVV